MFCREYQSAHVFSVPSTMVENAWQWAATQGKVYKHPINKAEYIDIDVDRVKEKQNQRVAELSASSQFAVEDK